MLKFEGELPFGGSVTEQDSADEVRRLLGYELDDADLPFGDDADEPGAEVWQDAPATSAHVLRFRFLDADPAEIHVRFKDKAGADSGGGFYRFPPGQRDHARVVYEEMSAANHPGIVIWEWLIRGGVPWHRG